MAELKISVISTNPFEEFRIQCEASLNAGLTQVFPFFHYPRILFELPPNPKFGELISLMKMVRNLYDKLSTDELLFLIYSTYEDYTDKSSKSKELLSPSKRSLLAKNLLQKGLITEKRYFELVG